MEKDLSKLSINDQNNEAQFLKDIVLKASSHDINVKFEGIKEVKHVALRWSNTPIDQLVGLGIIPILVDCLKGNDKVNLGATLTILINISGGTDEQTQTILDEGVLKYIPGLLLSSNHELVSNALWLLSNIVGGNQEQIQAVIDAGLIPSIIKALTKEYVENRREAARAVSNISQNGSTEQIMFLVDNGLILSLCHVLTLTDKEVLMEALKTMKNIIKLSGDRQKSVVRDISRCGGLDSVQMLESHGNSEIQGLASEILKKLEEFPFEDEEEEAMNFEENC